MMLTKVKLIPEDTITFLSDPVQPTKSFLNISNPSNKKIAFKVKTTNPKGYTVKPFQGVLQEGSEIAVEITSQAGQGGDAQQKDKFQVLITELTILDVLQNCSDLWNNRTQGQYQTFTLRTKHVSQLGPSGKQLSASDFNDSMKENNTLFLSMKKRDEEEKDQIQAQAAATPAFNLEEDLKEQLQQSQAEVKKLQDANNEIKQQLDELRQRYDRLIDENHKRIEKQVRFQSKSQEGLSKSFGESNKKQGRNRRRYSDASTDYVSVNSMVLGIVVALLFGVIIGRF